MCQSKAYLVSNGEERLLADEVSNVAVSGSSITLQPLFGEPIFLNGRIREIDLMSHRIVLEAEPAPGAKDARSSAVR